MNLRSDVSEKNSSPLVDFTTSGQWLIDGLGADSDDIDSNSKSTSVWDTIPVDIETFLYDKQYLNLSIRLSEPQLQFVDVLSNIFSEIPITEGVLMAGQGSGKDTCSIFVGLRIVYLLHCLRSPQEYFKMDRNSFIDAINVAPNADLAKNIYFQTLVNTL